MAKGAQDQTLQVNDSLNIAIELRNIFNTKIAEIGETAKIIEQISSQVNMLALNASIEAARAGEYGRGFSVVADNIRSLADETNRSVSQVQSTVASLQSSLSSYIDRITTSIEKVAVVAEETASGSEESSAATEEQSATMEELTASAQELANVAIDLDNVIKRFILSAN